MRLKLDENLGVRVVQQLRRAGHDVTTVVEQKLTSATDDRLMAICQAEARCLVTLDLDFANPLRFDPRVHSGIAVLRLSRRPVPNALSEAIDALIRAFAEMDIVGKLWVVHGRRIRTFPGEPDPAA